MFNPIVKIPNIVDQFFFFNPKGTNIIYGKTKNDIWKNTFQKLHMLQRFTIHISISKALRIPILG